ncbi:MAG: haloacid dehalogenase [Rhodospirillales bacterium CG15_BIG_FIL_POST_REV_8_21_14_020_66_15]|nr:MAG: haloacid dehalogenase [Rhodospirillales bacterium CG15_BIG_FIL_POST_REV_8_21_14_020_66_15]
MNSLGLFLDFDGTLADSLDVMRNVYSRFLSDHGARPTDEEFDRLNGPPLNVIVADMKETHQLQDDVPTLRNRYLTAVRRGLADAPPAPGAGELLAAVHGRNWTVGVVTSSDRRLVDDWLDRTGLRPFVAEVVGGGDVARGKPDPEPYRVMLARTGCDPERSWAIEDSRKGAQSSLSAGLRTAVVAARANRENWPAGVHFISDLRDMLARID